ncbi:MAG: aldo/keto reductase, partial [Myxococcales bacterium]|nr:aldo/keto reductase [Myxococcales bacterium]
ARDTREEAGRQKGRGGDPAKREVACDTPPMRYRRLPGVGIEVSVIGFGCWAIGKTYWGEDVRDERSIAAIHAALDQGVTLFDTAPLYGHGHADALLRRALGRRIHELVVATKVGVRWEGTGGHALSDLSPRHLREDCEASLRRLGLDRIELLQVHWPCERGTPLEQSLEALTRLREEGKIRAFGLCNYGPEALGEARRLLGFEAGSGLACLQTPYSMIRREFEHGLLAQVAPDSATPALGVLAYEALGRGLLTGKFDRAPRFPESDLRSRDERFSGSRFARARPWLEALRGLARRIDQPAAALALAWVLSRPGITATLAGAKGPEQVEQNCKAAELFGRRRLVAHLEKVANAFPG